MRVLWDDLREVRAIGGGQIAFLKVEEWRRVWVPVVVEVERLVTVLPQRRQNRQSSLTGRHICIELINRIGDLNRLTVSLDLYLDKVPSVGDLDHGINSIRSSTRRRARR